MIEEIARQTRVPEQQVRHVIEEFCRHLHKTAYEYDGGNGDFVCEQLPWDMGDFAWLHLYQFLLLHSLKYGQSEYPDDAIGMSHEMLERMGGNSRWGKYFHECQSWKMADQFGMKELYK